MTDATGAYFSFRQGIRNKRDNPLDYPEDALWSGTNVSLDDGRHYGHVRGTQLRVPDLSPRAKSWQWPKSDFHRTKQAIWWYSVRIRG